MLGLDRARGWKGPIARLALVAVVAIAACSLEVNINTGRADDEPAAASPSPPVPSGGIVVPEVDRDVAEAPALPKEPPPVRAELSRVETAVLERRLARETQGTEPTPPAPPAAGEGPQLEDGPTFTPFTVAPSIVNREEVIGAMQAEYPPLLRGAGIGGTVRMYFFIGDDGVVRKRVLDQGSGHPALDEAAMRVAATYRFTPALNRGEKVPVWVSFPITFQVN